MGKYSALNTSSREKYLSLTGGKTYIRWDLPRHADEDNKDSFEDSTAMTNAVPSRQLPTILLLHGATVPSWQFDLLVPYLLEATRCRILRIDLFGHGNSSMLPNNNAKFDMSLFVEQVREVLHMLVDRGDISPSSDIYALGHSLGAAVMAGVASSVAPNVNIRKVVLCAPMLNFIELQPHMKLLSVPLLGEALMICVIVPYLQRRRTKRYGAIGCHHLGERFVEQTKEPGHSQALLGLFRDGCLEDQKNLYRDLAYASSNASVMIMFGSEDSVASEGQIRRIFGMIGNEKGLNVRWECFEGLEHSLLLSHPELCAKTISDFFSQQI